MKCVSKLYKERTPASGGNYVNNESGKDSFKKFTENFRKYFLGLHTQLQYIFISIFFEQKA
jgi:hypothetical protein